MTPFDRVEYRYQPHRTESAAAESVGANGTDMGIQNSAVAVALFVIFVVILAAVLWGPQLIHAERPSPNGSGFEGDRGSAGRVGSPGREGGGPRARPDRKEKYGSPPGMVRATHRHELGYRGWADAPAEYVANTASSISHGIIRSA